MGFLPLQGSVPNAELTGVLILTLTLQHRVQKKRKHWKEAKATMIPLSAIWDVILRQGLCPYENSSRDTSLHQDNWKMHIFQLVQCLREVQTVSLSKKVWQLPTEKLQFRG